MLLEEEITLGFSEAVYEESRWEAALLFSIFAALWGRHTDFAGLGDFCYCCEDPLHHTAVEGDILSFTVKGECEEFSHIIFLPLCDQFNVDVVERGCGVGVMDGGHVGASVFVNGFM